MLKYDKMIGLKGDGTMAQRPIVILGPMESESGLLKNALKNSREEKIGEYSFFTGELEGVPAVVCRCYIGVVNSAVCAALAVRRYDPLCVIIQGTAGAHDPELHKGDIVLGERMVNIGRYFTPHRDIGEGSAPFDWEPHGSEVVAVEPENEVMYLHSDSRILDLAERVPYTRGKVVRGTIGAADIWNRELDMIAHLRKTLGTLCEEMEGYGVAQVCAQLGVPMADIRVISNSELYPDEDFDESVGVYCQEYIVEIIKRMAKIDLS